jgi:hypothetical protein
MIDRSNEIIKQLNRLANDRSLPPKARNKMLETAQHIKDLYNGVQDIRELYLKLKDLTTGQHSLDHINKRGADIE